MYLFTQCSNLSINMQSLSGIFVLFGVTCFTLAKPYEYSYYLSLPGHYQSLAVRDGEASVNEGPPLLPVNPNFRQGRVGPGLDQNPQFRGRFPVNANAPDFRRGREDPYYNEDFPNGELDPLFNQGGRLPQDQGRYYPASQNGDFDYRFNQAGSNTPRLGRPDFPQNNFNYYNPVQPEFGARIPPNGTPQRAPLTQEIDESPNEEKEEVTTQEPCSFCGVDRVNPMDGIDGANADPDSEPIEPKYVGGSKNPNFVVTPASVVLPGYSLNNAYVPYYVLV